MPLSRQSDKINMLNQSITDLQAQLIAKDKQIAFLQGQIYSFQWMMQNSMNDSYTFGEIDLGDLDLGDDEENT